ncbi:MAG: hypothetical protein MRZ90_06305 [Candidatus Gastranaerophilales bacterium]|nr:hypothetical protein [Candidatus Gastranaerophilales bacterium]
MINQVNLNTANAFTTSIQDKNTTSEIPISNNPLSIPEENIDTFDLQSNEKVDENKKEKKKPMPVWLKAILACVGTMAAVLGTGYVTTKLGYTPFKTDTKGLLNSRTTEFEKGAKAAVGEITSVMTLNSHCAQKSLEKLPTTHQGLIVVLDSQGAKGVKTLESKFKDKIIYGGELKLSELKNYGKLNEYVQKIAEKIKGKENYANITFASENTRCANMLNAVLRAHGEDKTAQTYDFVEGGIPSHYFWGSKGLNSEKLDEAIWDGWCKGLEIQSENHKQEPQSGAESQPQHEDGVSGVTGKNSDSVPVVPAKSTQSNSVKEDDKTKETKFVSEFAKLFQSTEEGKKHGAFDCNVSKITTKEQFLKHLTKEARNALIRDITEFSSLSEESKSKSITATRNKKKIEICINSAADPSDNISTVTLTVGNKNNEIKFSFSLKDLIEASIQKYNKK